MGIGPDESQQLLRDSDRRRFAAQPESDALTMSDALMESQLLEVHFDVLRSSASLLFDCRGALQIEMAAWFVPDAIMELTAAYAQCHVA